MGFPLCCYLHRNLYLVHTCMHSELSSFSTLSRYIHFLPWILVPSDVIFVSFNLLYGYTRVMFYQIKKILHLNFFFLVPGLGDKFVFQFNYYVYGSEYY